MSTATDTKSAYAEKLEAQLDHLRAEMDALEAKARIAKADKKNDLQKDVGEIRQRWESAKSQVKEVRQSSGEAWEDLKRGTDVAVESLKDAVQRAKKRFE